MTNNQLFSDPENIILAVAIVSLLVSFCALAQRLWPPCAPGCRSVAKLKDRETQAEMPRKNY